MRFGERDPDRGAQHESVQMPRRRPGALGAVGGDDGVAVALAGPAGVAEQRGDRVELTGVGGAVRVALQDQVDPGSRTDRVQAGLPARLRDFSAAGPLVK